MEHSYPSVRQFATILRDPFETAVSSYFFLRRATAAWKSPQAQAQDLEDYLAQTPANILNHFPKPVTRDNFKAIIEEYFVHIGVVESLDATLLALATRLGQAMPGEGAPFLNSTPRDLEIATGLRDL